MLLTPVCPHNLHARPLVLSEEEEIAVDLQTSYNDMVLTIDGQNMHGIKPDDKVIVRRSPYRVRFIRLGGKNYLQTLRAKLWQDHREDENR